MKKILFSIILFFLIFLAFLTFILTTNGIKTKKFNNLISQKINENNNKIKLKLETIRFKLDLSEISLFLETENPEIFYRDVTIPAKNIKVYIDFISLIRSETKIKKINFVLNQIDINDLKKLSISLKPSNFTSFINNKIQEAKLDTQIEVYLDENNLFENFIARGLVSNLKTEIINGVLLEKTNFSFFADKSDILIKNFTGITPLFEIQEGDLKMRLSPEINLETNFKSIINYNANKKEYKNLLSKLDYLDYVTDLKADLNNSLSISFDKTYKINNYSYKNNGKITNARLDINSLNNFFFKKKIENINLIDTEIKSNFNSSANKNSIKFLGKYSVDKKNYLSFDLNNILNKKSFKLKLNLDYDQDFGIDIVNFQKPKGKISKIFIDLEKHKDVLKINEINLKEEKNLILLKGIKLNNEKFISLEEIKIKTYKKDIKNNDFSIFYKKNISIEGSQFDASNLPKIFNKKSKNNFFSNINSDIEIDLTNIIAPLSEKLGNFKLIGRIEKGKFTKISSKGEFRDNKFLDISMKNDKKNNKKYLEIYSDITKPLLTEYNFFKGLSGGKLLYSSVIEENSFNSKLRIEKFKVINAPGMVKLLSLADLGGLADLAEGEGLSFDVLEISMEKTKDTLNLNEILALGPSVSVLMEGYQNPKVTSLRGTLVPAKTLNKMISKIPVIGDIVIPKEVGEGLFGISFKMKGPPGEIKTTINPIRTITPRFIQKIIDRKKETK